MVSIVIPIYNVEKYLKRCLDSVIKQTYQDIEIIAVSDASPDNSEQIVEEYANNDDRIKLVVIEHSGTSAAVAAGVIAAKGEYIAFVDPDDYVGEDLIQNFVDEIEDCDVVCMGYYKHYPSGITESTANIKIDRYFTDKDSNILKDDLLSNNKLMTVSRWSNLYKKSVLENFIDVYGELKLNMYEDWFFKLLLLGFLKKYKACSKVNSYYYCVNSDSIVRSIKSIEDYYINIEKLQNAGKIISEDFDSERSLAENRVYNLSMHYINQYILQLNKKEACIFIKNILKSKDFQSSLYIIKKFNGKLPIKRNIKLKINYVICRLKLTKVLYFIKKRIIKKEDI